MALRGRLNVTQLNGLREDFTFLQEDASELITPPVKAGRIRARYRAPRPTQLE